MLRNRGESGVLPRKIRDVYGIASMVVPYGSGGGRIGGWDGCGSIWRVARGFKPRGVVRTRSSDRGGEVSPGRGPGARFAGFLSDFALLRVMTRIEFDPRVCWPRFHHVADATRSPDFPPGGGTDPVVVDSLETPRAVRPRTSPPPATVPPLPREPLRQTQTPLSRGRGGGGGTTSCRHGVGIKTPSTTRSKPRRTASTWSTARPPSSHAVRAIAQSERPRSRTEIGRAHV